METESASELNRFLVVDFTEDGIAYKSNLVEQSLFAQDYYDLQPHLLAQKRLFEDPDFPATTQTILGHASTPKSNIQWLRPAAITARPKFFVEKTSKFNTDTRPVLHGFLTAAIVSLTTNDRAFRRTVPTDNSFDDKLYTGMFHFRFWKYGRWQDVVIDDRLPIMDGKLIFMSPTQQNEFGYALLEKAYAKFRGSFGAVASSTVHEAMQNFTGGITERYYLGDAVTIVDNCYDTIQRKLEKGSIMAAIKVHRYQGSDKFSQYAYSILKTTTIENMLICLQTPLEELVELNYLHDEETADCYSKSWIQFEEFVRSYDRVEICNLILSAMGNASGGEYSWSSSFTHGTWISHSTAGGPKDEPKSFWKNPQYIVQLAQADQIDDSGMCHLVISLMQKPRADIHIPISFVVFRISEDDFRSKPVPMSFSKKKEPTIVAYPNFSSGLEVTSRVRTLPGILLIVPCTQQRGQAGEFFLRIYSCPHQKTNDNVESPTMNEETWNSIVREFFSMADKTGSIDQSALATILRSHFFNASAKRGKGLWRSLSRKRTPSTIEADSSSNRLYNDISRGLFRRMRLDLLECQMNYHHFKQTAHDIQRWKEMFDLYDIDRRGHVVKKRLVKSLRRSLEENDQKHAVKDLLGVVEESNVEQIHVEEFVLFLLKCEFTD